MNNFGKFLKCLEKLQLYNYLYRDEIILTCMNEAGDFDFQNFLVMLHKTCSQL